ncbi:MAG TPA: hypothetical protein VFF04_02680 [Candidatus Babeliales bacterium]|nr:hypothetical protein [Candidatus Babeliales bacterium]
MKKIMIVLLIIYAVRMQAHIDCLDTSKHLASKYDSHEYYLVKDCDCPCGTGKDRSCKILSLHGQCMQCGHYRYPRPMIITSLEPIEMPVINVKKFQHKKPKKNKKLSMAMQLFAPNK